MLFEFFDSRAFESDNHTGFRGVNVNTHVALRAFDNHFADSVRVILLFDEFADFVVFVKICRKIFFAGIPVGVPIGYNAHSESVRIYFLSHTYLTSFTVSSITVI